MLFTNQTSQGTIVAIAANFLYAGLFLFGLLMQPLSGTQVASLAGTDDATQFGATGQCAETMAAYF